MISERLSSHACTREVAKHERSVGVARADCDSCFSQLKLRDCAGYVTIYSVSIMLKCLRANYTIKQRSMHRNCHLYTCSNI